jgi:hypothetical protein
MCPPRCFPKLGTHQLMEVERYGLHRQSMTHSSSSIASESGTDVHGHFLLRGSNVRSSQAIHKAAPEGATLLLGPPHPKAPPRRPTAGRSGWGRSRLPTSRASGHPWRHNQGACREAKQTVSTGQTKEGTSRWLAQRGRLQRRWRGRWCLPVAVFGASCVDADGLGQQAYRQTAHAQPHPTPPDGRGQVAEVDDQPRRPNDGADGSRRRPLEQEPIADANRHGPGGPNHCSVGTGMGGGMSPHGVSRTGN